MKTHKRIFDAVPFDISTKFYPGTDQCSRYFYTTNNSIIVVYKYLPHRKAIRDVFPKERVMYRIVDHPIPRLHDQYGALVVEISQEELSHTPCLTPNMRFVDKLTDFVRNE